MKLAFNGQAHYTDFKDGYDIYIKRSRGGEVMDFETYKRVVRKYCKHIADTLAESGIADLPNDLGSIAACVIKRRPQYRGKKFIGYGKMDWQKGHYDGKLKTFGLVFLPKRGIKNIRCYGFVANRQLYKRVKEIYEQPYCKWVPIQFNDEMI